MFDYDIKGKQSLDKKMMKELAPFYEQGAVVTRIRVSPQIFKETEQVFPTPHKHTFEFDSIPVIEDDSLEGEEIAIDTVAN